MACNTLTSKSDATTKVIAVPVSNDVDNVCKLHTLSACCTSILWIYAVAAIVTSAFYELIKQIVQHLLRPPSTVLDWVTRNRIIYR